MSRVGKTAEKKPRFWYRIHRIVKEIEPWGILLAVIAFAVTLVQFQSEYRDRIEEREVHAWQLLATKTMGNSGKIAALEHLNKEDGLVCFEWLRGKLDWLPSKDADTTCVILFKKKIPLSGIDLSSPDINMPGVFLKKVDLSFAILAGANLYKASLMDAVLTGANLADANLKGADLKKARLAGAILEDADLIGANLTGAILAGAGFTRADLTGACLMEAYLKDADLAGAGFTRADLTDADLTGACLMETYLKDAILKNADLTRADLTRADLTRADLTRADLENADFTGADLRDVRGLTQSQLVEACGNEETKLPEGWTIDLCPYSEIKIDYNRRDCMNGQADKLNLDPKLRSEKIEQAKQWLANRGSLEACPAWDKKRQVSSDSSTQNRLLAAF